MCWFLSFCAFFKLIFNFIMFNYLFILNLLDLTLKVIYAFKILDHHFKLFPVWLRQQSLFLQLLKTFQIYIDDSCWILLNYRSWSVEACICLESRFFEFFLNLSELRYISQYWAVFHLLVFKKRSINILCRPFRGHYVLIWMEKKRCLCML